MRPYAKLPQSDADTDELVAQARQWAARLGFAWSGPGGAFRLECAGTPHWHVYSEWAGMGVTVDIDAQSGEVLAIEDAPFETIGERPTLPEALRPQTAEVEEFVCSRLADIGWLLEKPVNTRWDREAQVWHIAAKTADGARSIRTQVAGKAGHLRFGNVTSE
jgi:hypothetical protein